MHLARSSKSASTFAGVKAVGERSGQDTLAQTTWGSGALSLQK